MYQDQHGLHNRTLALTLILGIVAGLLIGTSRSASLEPMPRSLGELEAFIWSRVEDCHSSDGYLRCPRNPSLTGPSF